MDGNTYYLLMFFLTGMLFPALAFLGKYIVRQQVVKKDRLEKLEVGMLATLRQQYLLTAFYYIERGYIPFSISDSMEQIYQAYHGLGGNGSVTNIRDAVIKLPRKE